MTSFVDALSLAILAGLLVGLSLTDLRERRLPDRVTYPMAALGLILAELNGDIVMSLAGLVAGYLSLLLVETLYRRLRGREGLGRGDAKLLAAGGAWVGAGGLPMVVLIASASGLAWVGFKALQSGTRIAGTTPLPFGPVLSLGIIVVWLGQHYL